VFIDPGSPWQNAWIKSFNGRLRDELLNLWRFDSLLEAQVLIEDWRLDYNINRPHSAHGDLTLNSPVNAWVRAAARAAARMPATPEPLMPVALRRRRPDNVIRWGYVRLLSHPRGDRTSSSAQHARWSMAASPRHARVAGPVSRVRPWGGGTPRLPALGLRQRGRSDAGQGCRWQSP
jgi:hypothetical protein